MHIRKWEMGKRRPLLQSGVPGQITDMNPVGRVLYARSAGILWRRRVRGVCTGTIALTVSAVCMWTTNPGIGRHCAEGSWIR